MASKAFAPIIAAFNRLVKARGPQFLAVDRSPQLLYGRSYYNKVPPVGEATDFDLGLNRETEPTAEESAPKKRKKT